MRTYGYFIIYFNLFAMVLNIYQQKPFWVAMGYIGVVCGMITVGMNPKRWS